jgi:hypothetical protein
MSQELLDKQNAVVYYLNTLNNNQKFLIPIKKALRLLKNETATEISDPSPGGSAGKQLAKLYEFRIRDQYYKEGVVSGIDESISSWKEFEGDLFLTHIHFKDALIALWKAVDGVSLIGILVFCKDVNEV